jgi:release factor glutamine methyltransferase
MGADDLLAWRRGQLQRGGSKADFDWLLEFAGGLDWSQLQRLRLDPRQQVALRCGLGEIEALWGQHLQAATPLQYLVGITPWRDFELAVAPGVLIPRQETELLIDLVQALGLLDQPGTLPLLWADLGTGSGCLAMALAQLLPASQGLAVDCSQEALVQAGANLERQGHPGRVSLRQGSWWQPLQPEWGRLDLVLSNPPYIPTPIWQQLEPVVRDHEPALALDGGFDGLDALRAIAAGAPQALAPGGWLLLEHHHDQSVAVQALLAEQGLEAILPHQDLEGHWRFVSARRPVLVTDPCRSTPANTPAPARGGGHG